MNCNNIVRFPNFLLIFILLRTAICQELLLPQSNFMEFEYEEVLQCVVKLSNIVDNPYSILISAIELKSYQIFEIKNTKIIYGVHQNIRLISKWIIFNRVILVVNTIKQFEFWLQQLKLLRSWNSKAKFIVTVLKEQNMTRIFEKSWEYFVLNINVIQMVNGTSNIYTYFPYIDRNCKPNLNPKLHFVCNDKLHTDIYPYKVPKHFHGCNIRIKTYNLPPYTMSWDVDRYKPTEAGIEITMMEHLSEQLKFSITYLDHNYPNWGQRLSNRTYTFIYNDTFHKKVDLIIGMVPMDTIFLDDFENSVVYFLDMIVWWVPTAAKIPKWRNAMKLFNITASIVTYTTYVIYGLFWFAIGRTAEASNYYRDITGSFMAVWQIFLNFTIISPRSNPSRILYCVWSISCVLIYTAYQSNLVSILTQTYYEPQIKTNNELANSNLDYAFDPQMLKYFGGPNDELHRRVRNNFISCDLSEACMNRSAEQRDIAVFRNKRLAKFLIKKYYLDSEGQPKLFGFKSGVLAMPHLVAYKGYPFMPVIDDMILRMQSNGLMNKWNDEATFTKKYKSDLKPHALDFVTYLYAFFTYLAGMATGFVILICEIIYYKFVL